MHVAGADLNFIKGGTGRPLLVLHEELGHPGWLSWHSALAQSHTLYIPLHPGLGKSSRIEWISGVRDLACFYSRVIRDMGLSPTDVIGISMGGWIAAEMAANCAHQFRRHPGLLQAQHIADFVPPEGRHSNFHLLFQQRVLELHCLSMARVIFSLKNPLQNHRCIGHHNHR